jgi:predicted deacylase
LRKYLSIFDHQLLGDEVACGEALARSILLGLGCVKVEVRRPLEGLFAVAEITS